MLNQKAKFSVIRGNASCHGFMFCKNYLIFGCTGSLLLPRLASGCGEGGLLRSHGAQASPVVELLSVPASAAAAHGLASFVPSL